MSELSVIPRSATRTGYVHFVIAIVLLAVTAGGFRWAVARFQLVLTKEAIPWPRGVEVNPKSFRWSNMPEEVGGRFVLVPDGELTENGQKNGVPDGEIEIQDDMLEALGIGTGYDKSRIVSRQSNWLVNRRYRDNKAPVRDPLRYWQVDVYYYTGGMDTVPHVPERCMAAAGARMVDNKDIMFRIEGLPAPWGPDVAVRRAVFEVPLASGFGVQTVVEYYLFSLNGKPETVWEKVRLGLTKPWDRHVFFSKVQFGTLGVTTDIAKLDETAEEFLRAFLPVILKALPTVSDVKAMESDSGSSTMPGTSGAFTKPLELQTQNG